MFARVGFPHSEIPGSRPICGSPRLIAAYHVLPRLLVPRHPPYALSSLTIKSTRNIFRAALQGRHTPMFRHAPTICVCALRYSIVKDQATNSAGLGNRFSIGIKRSIPQTVFFGMARIVRSWCVRGVPPVRSVPEPSLVGLVRIELTTSSLSGMRSNQLSYRPVPPARILRPARASGSARWWS